MSYKIFDIFETDSSNVAKVEENFYSKEITLITCNNQNKLRLIIKAKKE